MKELTPKIGMETATQIFNLANYNQMELAELLVTNSTAVEVLQQGMMDYVKEAKSQIQSATDAALLSPKVTATYSIDEDKSETLDVTLWFASSDDGDLQSLREENYGGDSTSESIVAFMAFFNPDVERRFFIKRNPVVMCQVNQKEAENWFATHRPHILLEEDN